MNFYRNIFSSILLLVTGLAYTAVIHIPGDHPTIQAGVDAAIDGDTLLLANGVFSGVGNVGIHWDATQKHLVIMSEHGRDHCTIDCRGDDRAFFLNMGHDQRDVIDGLTITNGWVYGSGGAILIVSTSPRITNCRLVNNVSYSAMTDQYYGGGAIAVYDSAAPVIRGNIIRNNVSSLMGGGIRYNQFASGVLENNLIDGNFSGHRGGGGISLEHFSNPLIISNLIINNTSDSYYDGGFGGGISIKHSNPRIINNTIAYNRTGNAYYGGKGGGIAITKWEPYPVIRNCIIWDNVSGPSSLNIEFHRQRWLDISYCNVEEDLDHIFDLKPYTNIDSPPKFMDPENGDFRLHPNSPCINTGTPDTTGLHLPSMDLAGYDRVYEGRVDMGAFEFNRSTSLTVIPDREGFRVYPNPCSGRFFVEYHEDAGPDPLMVMICNTSGKRIHMAHFEVAERVMYIDISLQAGGVYFLTILSRRQVLYRQKLVKL